MSINKPLSGLGWRMKLFMKIQNKNLWNIYGSLMDIFDLKNLWTFLTKKIYLRDILCKARNILFTKKNGLKISLVEISNPFSIYIIGVV